MTSSRSVNTVIDQLLALNQPSIEYKVRVNVLGESADSAAIQKLQKRVKSSDLVQNLLRFRDASRRITTPKHVYAKWQGAHWVLAALADIGYPSGDRKLAPIRDQLQDYWLGRNFYDEFVTPSSLCLTTIQCAVVRTSTWPHKPVNTQVNRAFVALAMARWWLEL